MNEGSLVANALGDGWVLKLLGGLGVMAAGALGWIARRPLEKAGVMAVVNAAVQAQFTRFESEIDHVRAELVRCEQRHDECDEKANRSAERIDQLEGQVRQYQQLEQSRVRP